MTDLAFFQGSVVTIGNFDGVHRGHREILAETVAQAREKDLRAVALTFRPHPQVVLRPQTAPSLLLTYDEKREALLAAGLDEVVDQSFDRSLAATPPERFFQDIVVGVHGAKALVVGYDFSFGRAREGHLQVLAELCRAAGARLTVVPPQHVAEQLVSSSAIRASLGRGQIAEARSALGRPFFYRGTVVTGDQRGRQLGFPTANVILGSGGAGEKLLLPFGVYATRLSVDGQEYSAVSNLGVRPSFTSDSNPVPVILETHLLDQSLDLYGRSVEVGFIDRIREERRFPSLEALQAQITKDLACARQMLG
ncbi:MAG: hypothetical protein RJB38_1039 [Pseudomonadota bacterium]|jgi:riboflavin kinase/FMN adenylyltransferase